MSTQHFAPHPDALAPFAKRAAATLLDGLVCGMLAVVVLLAVSGGEASEDAGGIAFAFALFGFSGLVYAPLLMNRAGERNGQTLGKQWMGIRTVRADGAKVDLPTGLVREGIGKTVLGFVPFFTIVDYLFPLGDGHRQSLHDKIAKTYVVGAEHQHEFEDEPNAFAAAPVAEPVGQGWAPPRAPSPPASGEDERFGDFAPPVPPKDRD